MAPKRIRNDPPDVSQGGSTLTGTTLASLGLGTSHRSLNSIPIVITTSQETLHQVRSMEAALSHDVLDDRGYPQAISMSQMSPSTMPATEKGYFELETFTPQSIGLGQGPSQSTIRKIGENGDIVATSPFLGSIQIAHQQLLPSQTNEMDGPGSFSRSPIVFGKVLRTRSIRFRLANLEQGQLQFVRSSTSKIIPEESPTGTPSTTGSTFDWHPENLLILSDSVRTTLRESGFQSISTTDIARLEAMLDRFLLDEVPPNAVDLGIITQGRVDKLLGALCDGTHTITEESSLKTVVNKAHNLQRTWKLRLGAKYKSIDEDRLSLLRKEGVLHRRSLDEGLGKKQVLGKHSAIPHLEVGK